MRNTLTSRPGFAIRRRKKSGCFKLLDDRTGKLADVLEVERELSRVREETERMQGRMRVLAESDDADVGRLVVTEMRNTSRRKSRRPRNAPYNAFAQSLDGLREFGESLLIGAVALAPGCR